MFVQNVEFVLEKICADNKSGANMQNIIASVLHCIFCDGNGEKKLRSSLINSKIKQTTRPYGVFIWSSQRSKWKIIDKMKTAKHVEQLLEDEQRPHNNAHSQSK